MKRPLIFCLLVIVIGIVSVVLNIPFFFIAVSSIPIIFAPIFLNNTNKVFLVLLLMFFLLGYTLAYSQYNNSSVLESFNGADIILQGQIVRPPIEKENKIEVILQAKSYILNARNIEINDKVQIFIYKYNNRREYQVGDIICAKGQITVPKKQRNPGTFNYNLFLKAKGIKVQLYSNSNQCDVLTNEKISFFLDKIYKLKGIVQERIQNNLNTNQSVLIKGILFGEKNIKEDIKNSFINVGVAHILAVSGLHVGFIFAFVYYIIKFLKINKSIGFMIVVLSLVFYAIMTGLSVSVLRASMMLIVMLISQNINSKYDSLNALCLCAIIILINNPLSLFTVSFQLSFAAVLGIIMFYPILNKNIKKRIKIKSKVLNIIISTLLITACAQIGTLPISIINFNQISLISIFSNLLIVPLIGIILILTIVAILISFINLPISQLLFIILGELLDFIVYVVKIFNKIPFSYVQLSNLSIIQILSYIIFILVIFNYLYIKRRRLNIIIILLIFFSFSNLFNYTFINTLRVTFLDVGQGDSILIETPMGQNFLIDGGGYSSESKRSIGEDVLKPVLLYKKITTIDGIFVTHSHQDHMGGILEIIDFFNIKTIFINSVETKDYERLLKKAKENSIPVYTLTKDDQLKIEKNLHINVLYPTKLDSENKYLENPNNASLVLKLSYKDIDFLFTGDIEKVAEDILLDSNENLDIEVLKVAHHGSDTSSQKSFIEKTTPEIAIISVGEYNKFGHPSQKVLEEFKSRNIPYIRTDQFGAIEIRTNGYYIKYKTYLE